MISICVTVKNRSRVDAGVDKPLELFPNLVDSINRTVENVNTEHAFELVVTDWASDDWPLVEWFPDRCKIPYKLRTINDPGINRGMGRAIASVAAKGEILLFIDCDCLLVPRVIERGLGIVQPGTAWMLQHVNQPRPGTEDQLSTPRVTGNLFVTSEDYHKSGGWPVGSWRWGGEDCGMLDRLNACGVNVERSPCGGFNHQWHPTGKGWKDQYARESDKYDG